MRKFSYLSPKCVVHNGSQISRYGVFAKKPIKKGELITIWGGYVMTIEELRKLPKAILKRDYPVQVYKDFYLGPKSVRDLDDAEMFNHSCDANAGVKGQSVVEARRNIKSGEEITFDYETTDFQEMSFACKCGSPNCRGKIDGTSWKNPDFQKKNQGYFSYYLQEKIDKLRKKQSKRCSHS